MEKLTLSSAPEVVAQARRLAAASGISISAMFERLVRLLAGKEGSAVPLGPLTRRASGIIALSRGRGGRRATARGGAGPGGACGEIRKAEQ